MVVASETQAGWEVGKRMRSFGIGLGTMKDLKNY